jgi:UPF0755 protein
MENNEFQITESKTSPVRIISLIVALIIVVVISVGAYFLTKVNEAASSISVPINFEVKKGSSTKQIGQSLINDDVINSYWSFYFYVKFNNAGNKIQAGSYALDRNMTIAQIVDILTHGKVVPTDRRVTVVEGMTNKQLAADLESRNIFTINQFTAATTNGSYSFAYNDIAANFHYEGFLFPDTYEITKDATVDQLIQKMLSNFQSKITDQMKADITAKKMSLKDVIILASIIEKEVGRNKDTITADDITQMQVERGLVASVFYNRLAAGMPLESDATVNYITGKADRSVTIADTKINSPYNTYKFAGLPPGPISNPGLNSIMAAIYPTKSDYLYFLNAPDGTAYFAKTLQQQLANKAKYLK